MSEKKHIDRLFQEKFKNFEEAPKEHVWKNIEKGLKTRKARKVVVLPLWYKIAGAAAVIALVFFTGNWISNDLGESKVVHSEEKIEKELQGPTGNNASDVINAIVIGETTIQEENKNAGEKNKQESATSFQHNEREKIVDKKNSSQKGLVSNAVDTETAAEEISKKEKQDNSSTDKIFPTNRAEITHLSLAEQNGKREPASGIEESTTVQKSFAEKHIQNDFTPKQAKEQKGIVSNHTERSSEVSKTVVAKAEKSTLSSNNKKSLLEVASAKEQQKEYTENNTENGAANTSKWQISPFAAPIYYSSFGGGNAVDPSLAQNESTGGTTMAYGVNFSYKVSDRLEIRSGVSQVSMNYHVKDIAFVSAVQPAALKNVAYNVASTNLKIVSKHDMALYASNSLLGEANPLTSGTLNQQYGFIEVPLELEYFLIDKKFDLSIIGGASTLFLNGNDIAIKSKNGITNIGEASNLNQVSFSTNIGLGLGYDISEQFEISIEPMFKYQLNTFSENINGFKPYYLGVYSGFSFKF